MDMKANNIYIQSAAVGEADWLLRDSSPGLPGVSSGTQYLTFLPLLV
jgi:hypothetical protein